MDILGWNIPLWLILILLLICVWLWQATSEFGVFKKLGIPGPRPIPGIGTLYTYATSSSGPLKMYLDMKKKYKSDVIGIFFGRTPVMVFYDVEAVKQITVKDFSNFTNRMGFDSGSPLNRMMNTLKDDHWRHVRRLVSPAFSGTKLRRMTAMINRCGQTFVKNLQISAKSGDAFECKEYAGAFTMDVIASTAFSIDVDSLNNNNNVFVRMAKKLMNMKKFSARMMVVVFFPYLVPYLAKYFGWSIFPPDCTEFFLDIVDKAMKERTENPEEAPKDFLQMMMNAEIDQEDNKKDDTKPPVKYEEDFTGKWSTSGLIKEDIFAQCLIFFMAGYDTVADAASFTMYNLATHPDYQERAFQEILDVLQDKDEPDYDDMKKMTYIEMCIDESMRMYPHTPTVEREPTEETIVNGITVPKGMIVQIPIAALHNDPDVWDNPEKFDPERFTAEAKESRHPFQYLPFGLGPRACVAQRLAILEIKICIVHLLKNFKLVTCEKTQIPLKLQKDKIESQNGIWLKLEARK